jgi:chromosome segregation ATPase
VVQPAPATWTWLGLAKFVFWAPAGLPQEERHALMNARLGVISAAVTLGVGLTNIPAASVFGNEARNDSGNTDEDWGYAWAYAGQAATSSLAFGQLTAIYNVLSDLYQRHVDRLNGALTDTRQIIHDVGQLSTDVAQLSTDVGQLSTDVGQVGTDVGQLQTTVTNVTNVGVTNVSNAVGLVRTDVQAMQHDVTQLTQDLATTTNGVQANTVALGQLDNLAQGIDTTTRNLETSLQEEAKGLREAQSEQTAVLLKQLEALAELNKELVKQVEQGNMHIAELSRELATANENAALAKQILEKLQGLEAKIGQQK